VGMEPGLPLKRVLHDGRGLTSKTALPTPHAHSGWRSKPCYGPERMRPHLVQGLLDLQAEGHRVPGIVERHRPAVALLLKDVPGLVVHSLAHDSVVHGHSLARQVGARLDQL
jgi:hypothetical protein